MFICRVTNNIWLYRLQYLSIWCPIYDPLKIWSLSLFLSLSKLNAIRSIKFPSSIFVDLCYNTYNRNDPVMDIELGLEFKNSIRDFSRKQL